MRTKQEIKQAVAILCHKSDRLSLVQAEVLRGNMNRTAGIPEVCYGDGRRHP